MNLTSLWAYLHDYIAIMFGLAMGTVAHFGRMLSTGEELSMKHVFGFIMQLGLIGLFASVVTRQLGMQGDDLRALTTAILAVSAQEITQWAKRNGWLALVRQAVPTTEDGQRRQSEQISRSASYLERKGKLDEAPWRGRESDDD